MSIKGMYELMKDLKAMRKLPDDEVKIATHDAAEIIVNAAKAKCTSSHVRNAIGYITTKDANFPTITLIGVKYTENIKDALSTITAAGLAYILEYGAAEKVPQRVTVRRKTRKREGEYTYPTYKKVLINGKWVTMSIAKPFRAIPARPFWRPAIDENRKRVQEVLIDKLSQLIDKQANNFNLK